MTKIFGIGLHKTGTTTLAECLHTLGYSVCPEELAYLTRHAVVAGSYRPTLRLVLSYDAFEDSPWNYKNFYRILDVVFPEAKFVLTARGNEGRWFESLLRWTALYNSASALNIISTLGLAVTPGDRKEVLAAYRAHNNGVVEYFAGQPDRLLVVDWEAGDGWEKLCGFLGVPVPRMTFPHALRYDSELMEFVTNEAVPLTEPAAPEPAAPEPAILPEEID